MLTEKEIDEMVIKYIGYPPEIDEGLTTYMRRDAYKQGVKDCLKKLNKTTKNG